VADLAAVRVAEEGEAGVADRLPEQIEVADEVRGGRVVDDPAGHPRAPVRVVPVRGQPGRDLCLHWERGQRVEERLLPGRGGEATHRGAPAGAARVDADQVEAGRQ
jgi:hypothetical protein